MRAAGAAARPPSGSGGGSTGALRNNPEFAAGVRAIREQNWQGAGADVQGTASAAVTVDRIPAIPANAESRQHCAFAAYRRIAAGGTPLSVSAGMPCRRFW